MRSPSKILWCQTCYKYFAKYTRCISAGRVIPSIILIIFPILSQMKISSQRQSLLSIPQNGAEQKISQQRQLKLSLNEILFFTLVGLSQLFQIFFFLNHPASISQCPFNALNGCLCQKIDQRTHPNGAFLLFFLSPFKPSIMCFSFVACVSKDRSFEASHWRPAQHVRPPDANFSCPPQSFRLQPFSAS